MSDRIGRRLALCIQLGGLSVGYALMSFIDARWPLWLALALKGIISAAVVPATAIHLNSGRAKREEF